MAAIVHVITQPGNRCSRCGLSRAQILMDGEAVSPIDSQANCPLPMALKESNKAKDLGYVPPSGSASFHALLGDIAVLHDSKQADYGSQADPFANIRSTEEWGVPGWVGALIRANDKMHRLKRFAERGSLANESAEDSMLDIAVYVLVALVLYREQSE